MTQHRTVTTDFDMHRFERDGYVVVDQVARGFVLRSGSEVTQLYNDGFRDRIAGPLSPHARPKPKYSPPWKRK